MAQALETLLFAAYSAVAVALILASGLRAASARDQGLAGRIGIAALSLATLPCFALAAVSHLPGAGLAGAAQLALPLLALCCAWSNARLLPGLGFGGRAFVSTALCWNLVLALCYGLHALSEIAFVELGAFSTVPLAAHGLVQGIVGTAGAEALPVYAYLPILLPSCREGGFALGTRAIGGAGACAMLGVFGLAIPAALDAVRVAPEVEGAAISPRGDITTSLRIGDETWGAPLPLGPSRDRVLAKDLERAQELGAREVALSIRADLVEDDTRMTRLGEAAQRVRGAGLRLAIRVTMPKPGAVAMHPQPFAATMKRAHWIVMERLSPDLLVLFDRPLSTRARGVVGTLPSAKWVEIIRSAVRQIAEGKASQRCAVTLEATHPRSREIWIEVAGGRGPHEVRFWIEGSRHGSAHPERACLNLEGWLAESPPRIPVSIIASAPTPRSFGGHAAGRVSRASARDREQAARNRQDRARRRARRRAGPQRALHERRARAPCPRRAAREARRDRRARAPPARADRASYSIQKSSSTQAPCT